LIVPDHKLTDNLMLNCTWLYINNREAYMGHYKSI